jgi:hypothetical protein
MAVGAALLDRRLPAGPAGGRLVRPGGQTVPGKPGQEPAGSGRSIETVRKPRQTIVLMGKKMILVGKKIILVGKKIVLEGKKMISVGKKIVLEGTTSVERGNRTIVMGDRIVAMAAGTAAAGDSIGSLPLRIAAALADPLYEPLATRSA